MVRSANSATSEHAMGPGIACIINFIRGHEPRPHSPDLVEPVRQQLALLARHGLRGTFLLQHDALDARFLDLLCDTHHELGAWFEVTQSLCERIGLPWRGRYSWDWHAHVGMTVGYTPAQRILLADALLDDVQTATGRPVRSVGAWYLDAVTLSHLASRGVIASCNCKDQLGTDGYSLWGGPWNHGYRPSRRHALMPGRGDTDTIPLALFRMLGSDPLTQYEQGIGGIWQDVLTLEPVSARCGGDPSWVRWFYDQNLGPQPLAFGWLQAGQENSFGWPAMTGLEFQFAELARRAGHTTRILTLAEAGDWFLTSFADSPACAVIAHDHPQQPRHGALWYHDQRWRASLAWDGVAARIRDLHLFPTDHYEPNLHMPVPGPECVVDTPALIDGHRWSTAEQLHALVVRDVKGTSLGRGRPTVREGDQMLIATWDDGLHVICNPDGLTIRAPGTWYAELTWRTLDTAPVAPFAAGLVIRHEGRNWTVPLRGQALMQANGLKLSPSGDGVLVLGPMP